jgi:lipooligosaccharide transport system ATP-binding protein
MGESRAKGAHVNGRSNKIVINASSIAKRFGEVVAVDDISFEVRHGETYGLLGPNGAGKTTTMRMVSGLSPLTGGKLIVAGIDVSREGRAVRNVLGVVTQQDGLDTDLNARDNLITYGFIAGLSRALAEQRADAVLMYFDLTDKSNEEIDNLSGGMKRRLAIARAFMTKPQVIVLDEPTTGLDPQGRNSVWQELETMKQAGVTVLMSTHYMEEAAALCDRLAIMDHGKILAEGAPDELVNRHAGPEVAQVRVSNGARQDVVDWIGNAGFDYREAGAVITVTSSTGTRPDLSGLEGVRVSYRPSNLEDVFLSMAGRKLTDE